MVEFKYGIFETIKRQVLLSSIGRTIVYTLGHICIAMTSNMIITGAQFEFALADAIIEPCINGVWYYLLDKAWTSYIPKKPA
jgi:uncharacterized membrane protein